MKNKFTAVLLASTMVFSSFAVLADTQLSSKVMLAIYDKDKYLIAVKSSSEYSVSDDGVYTVTTDEIPENADTYKLVICDSGKIISNVNVKNTISVDSPSVEPIPESTPVPSVDPTPYPSAYPSKKDAVNALILVKDVSQALDADDNTVTKINAFYQGVEIELLIDNDTELKYIDDISTVKPGDMLHMVNSLNGKIKTISLDYRPLSKDILCSDSLPSSFQTLLNNSSANSFSSELGKKDTGYIFGVITDKSSSTLTIYDTDGLADSSVDLTYTDNTIVYTVDMSKRTAEADISSKGGISKSSITKSYFDEDDNITEWSSDNTYRYALANVIDGEIAEIIIYSYDKSGK